MGRLKLGGLESHTLISPDSSKLFIDSKSFRLFSEFEIQNFQFSSLHPEARNSNENHFHDKSSAHWNRRGIYWRCQRNHSSGVSSHEDRNLPTQPRTVRAMPKSLIGKVALAESIWKSSVNIKSRNFWP